MASATNEEPGWTKTGITVARIALLYNEETLILTTKSIVSFYQYITIGYFCVAVLNLCSNMRRESIENAIYNAIALSSAVTIFGKLAAKARNLFGVRSNLSVGFTLHTCDINKEDFTADWLVHIHCSQGGFYDLCRCTLIEPIFVGLSFFVIEINTPCSGLDC